MDTATDSALTVRAGETVDAVTSLALRCELRAAITRLPDEVIADLGETRFLDTSGLATLVGALRYARAHDVGFAVVCAYQPVLKMFRIAGLAEILDVRSGEEVPGG